MPPYFISHEATKKYVTSLNVTKLKSLYFVTHIVDLYVTPIRRAMDKVDF